MVIVLSSSKYEHTLEAHTNTSTRVHKAYLIYCFVHIVLTLKITLCITAPDE